MSSHRRVPENDSRGRQGSFVAPVLSFTPSGFHDGQWFVWRCDSRGVSMGKARPWMRRLLLHPSIARFKADLACRLMVRDERYETWLAGRVAQRASRLPGPEHPGLVSFLTTVWNTSAKFLAPMADSVLGQSPHRAFEWVLLDNGSTAPDTLRELARIARDARVRLLRVDQNLGIVGGMRYCLERATGRYVVPVDSDDLLARDTVTTLARHLAEAGWPALAYSDEDHLIGRRRVLPYFKPEWDPVLFANSAYIAHLGAIDRVRALELGVYSDDSAKGCHDWDTFVRFLAAGETPLHIPEMLYSWRMHSAVDGGERRLEGLHPRFAQSDARTAASGVSPPRTLRAGPQPAL